MEHLKAYISPYILAMIVTFIALIGSDLELWLRFDRVAIADGQLWRLVSAHFVHLGWSHLGMNLTGLLLIWALFGSHYSNKIWMLVFLLSCLGVSLLLLWLNPELRWYVGLSGVLHTFFIMGCLADIQQSRWGGIGLLIAIVVKLIYEQMAGPLPGSEATAGGRVIVDAHLYGAICGVFCYSGVRLYRFYLGRRL